MATISVPLSKEHEEALDVLVQQGVGSSRADVMRRALSRMSEQEAVEAVLRANKEPSLSGDLRALAKKIK